jgi:hypothetical protein
MTTRVFTSSAWALGRFLAGGRVNPVNGRCESAEPAWRRLALGASILSLVLGLMVLIPIGLAVSPLLLAYSRLTGAPGTS